MKVIVLIILTCSLYCVCVCLQESAWFDGSSNCILYYFFFICVQNKENNSNKYTRPQWQWVKNLPIPVMNYIIVHIVYIYITYIIVV